MKISTFAVCSILIAAGISFCKKGETPPFRQDMTSVSTPKAGKLPYYRGEIMDPWWVETTDQKSAASLPENLRRLNDFSLVSDSGREIARQSIGGKYAVVGFFFSRCSGICPMVTANVKKLSAKITDQRDLVFLSMSVDPENDSAEVLKHYKARFAVAQENWLFLTGTKETIYALARKTFNADVVTKSRKGGAADFLHTENIYLLDKDSYLRGIYRTRGGMDLDRLVGDLELLRKNG
jgi:protein SCO1/2